MRFEKEKPEISEESQGEIWYGKNGSDRNTGF